MKMYSGNQIKPNLQTSSPVNSAPEATQARIQDLTQKYLQCIETIQAKHAESDPTGIGDIIGEEETT